MISSTLKTTGCLLFAFSIFVYAQQPAKKTSTISGKVIVKGKGIPGVFVSARSKESNDRGIRWLVATSDVQGNYRIPNVPPGTYEITTAAPQYVLSGNEPFRTLIVGDEESYENVDFSLVRGGTITGRITDAEGLPIVEERIEISSQSGNSGEWFTRSTQVSSFTDDRGIYRVFGLPPGKYKVSAGIKEDNLNFGMMPAANHKQTFYGATADQNKATVVEVGEGSEITNIDITLRRSQAMFTISGKIIDADTGRPIPNASYALEKFGQHGSYSIGGMTSNRQGEFTFDNMTPGNYAVQIERSATLDLYAEPVKFEVTDQDIKGLVLRASGGTTISGVIVLDGIEPKAAATQVQGMLVWAGAAAEQEQQSGIRQTSMTNADGSFRIGGMRPGLTQFAVYARNIGNMRPCDLTRLERNGAVEGRNIEIKAGEQISGLRLVVKCHRGGIQGVLKIENGDSLARERIQVYVTRVGDERFESLAQFDARGRFSVDGLKAGVYELSAVAYVNAGGKQPSVKQQVIVAEDQVSEVTLTLVLGPKP